MGEGALTFSNQCSYKTVSHDELICPRAKREWEYWLQKLNDTELSTARQSSVPDGIRDLSRLPQDTVGAVACDDRMFVAAGVSR